jgi:hypothetical protein
MNVELLLNDYNGQVLLMSESVMETRVNLNLIRVITWQHDTRKPWRSHEWQQFTTTIKESSQAHLTLMHVFHRYISRLSVGGPYTIPIASLGHHYGCGGVSSNSVTVEAIKFTGPHKSRMHQYIIDTSRATTFGALNMTPYLSPTFSSSILHFSLVVPSGLILNHLSTIPISQIIPFMNQGIKIPKSYEWNLPPNFYRSSIR